MRLELFGWQILLVGILVITCVISMPIVFSFGRGNQNPLKQYKRGKVPQYINTTNLSTSDLVSAVVSTRKGKMSPEDLSNLVVSALNGSLVSKDTAVKTLKEFGFNLVYLGDDKFTASKLGVSNE